MAKLRFVFCGAACLAAGIVVAKTCTWTANSGTWSDTACWADAAVPEAGDVVELAGSGGTIQLGGAATVALSAISNTVENSGWTISDGTLAFSDATCVIENTGTFLFTAQVAAPDTATLVKRGAGTLSLCVSNSALSCALVIENGRVQPVDDLSLGAVPETLRADAITLCGGSLFGFDTTSNVVTIASTRGVTVDGVGKFAGRSSGTLIVASPVTGNGDVCILPQSGFVRFDAVNSYMGDTLLGIESDPFAWGSDVDFSVGVDGALPSTTSLRSVKSGAQLSLSCTTQRIVGLDGGAGLALNGPGTLRFGAAGDGALALTNVSLAAEATLAYSGAGTLEAALTSAEKGTTFRLDSGALALNAAAPLGFAALSLYDGAAVSVGTDAMPNLLVLDGAASVTASEAVRFSEGVSGGTTLTLSGDQAYTFGTADGIVRPLDATLAPQGSSTVTLDGWIATSQDVSAFTKSSDCVVFAALTAGDQTVGAGESIGIASTSQTGTGSENIAVSGGTVAFAASGMLAASYAVTVSDGGVLEFGGFGTNDFSNASIAGSGSVRLMNGTAVLKGPLTTFAVSGEGGELYVPEGETVTVSDASGEIRKAGPGSLVFAGSSSNECTLVVKEGTVRLAASAVAVNDVVVEEGASLVLDGDEQIADGAIVAVYGTFDLNGHAETIRCFKNPPDSGIAGRRDASSASIVNTSSSEATLSTHYENAFFGSVTEAPGAISISTSSDMAMFVGPQGSAGASRFVTDGSARFLPYSRWTVFCFCFHAPRGEGQTFALSEIQLTYRGVPIPRSSITSVSSSSQLSSSYPAANLVDGKAATGWQAADGTNVLVQIAVSDMPAVDGYRFASASSTLRAPKSWDVYAYRSQQVGWVLLDRRRDENAIGAKDAWHSNFGGNPSTNYLFSASDFIGEPANPSADYVLEGAGTWEPGLRISALGTFSAGKISGSRDIRLEGGSTFAPADLSDWTGSFLFKNEGICGQMHRILLSSERGGPAEQPVRITETNANVSVENAGEQLVSVLINDDTPETPMTGRLADGNGPLGLVKRGSGTRCVETQDADYTGPTVVHGGTLKVVGPLSSTASVTARYLRIHPTKSNGGYDSNKFNWGMNDFQLLDADGNRIAFPSGTKATGENGLQNNSSSTYLTDGNIATRCLVTNTAEEQSGKTGYCSWVVIDMQSAVTFYGYRWYTAHNNTADQNRVPVQWTLEASDDGETWTTVDTRSDPYTLAYGSGTSGYLRGPYGFLAESTGASPLNTLPSEFFSDVEERSTRAPALKARYFRFTPHATWDPTVDGNAYGWMVSEFSLYRNGSRQDWPDGVSATLTGGDLNPYNGSAVSHFCDNVITGGTVQAEVHRCFVTEMPSYITVDAGEEVSFDAYTFFAAAGGCYWQRIPTAWTLSVSSDGSTWYDADSRVVSPDSLTKQYYAQQGLYQVGDVYPLLNATEARNSLGDDSPVTVDSGATLEIAAEYEKFGALSGVGTLAMRSGATAEVNTSAAAGASFSGTVSGAGTLVVSGTNAQNFADATFSGVSTLELEGGSVDGTASFGGADLTLAFTGGSLGGSLTGVGALTVTGSPVIRPPADPGTAFRKTLLTYDSIDATSASALESATFDQSVELPKGLKARVQVNATSCVLTIAADGTMVIIR